MGIGPPPPRRTSRVRSAARMLLALSAPVEPPEPAITHRVSQLRDQIRIGAYTVDPDRLASRLYQAMRAGGL